MADQCGNRKTGGIRYSGHGCIPCAGRLCVRLFRRTGGCKLRGGGEGSRRGPSYEGISVRERLCLAVPGDYLCYLFHRTGV